MGLAHPQLQALVEDLHHRQRVELAAVDAGDRDGAAAADAVDAGEQRRQPVDRRFFGDLGGERVGQQAGRLLGQLGERGARAVGLHADRVDGRVGTAAVGQLAQGVGDVVLVGEGDRLDPVAARHLQALGDVVDAEDPRRALVAGDPRRHLADRAEAEDRDRAALGDRRVVDRLPGGGEDVGEEEVALVGAALRHLDRPELRLRHPQVLGLAARAPGRTSSCSRTARRPFRTRVTWVVSHWAKNLRSHIQQCPQEMLKGMTTRSPALIWVTSEPTSSTIPIGSWPRMSPSSMNIPSTS